MDGAYDLAVKYAKEKLHRGSPISKFPSMQDKAARGEDLDFMPQEMLEQDVEKFSVYARVSPRKR